MKQQELRRGAGAFARGDRRSWTLSLTGGSAVAPSALFLQTTHRVIGAGVGEHSIYATDPVLRFRRSHWQTLGVAFYDAEYGRQVRAPHKPISGTDPRGRHTPGMARHISFVVATVMWAVEGSRSVSTANR